MIFIFPIVAGLIIVGLIVNTLMFVVLMKYINKPLLILSTFMLLAGIVIFIVVLSPDISPGTSLEDQMVGLAWGFFLFVLISLFTLVGMIMTLVTMILGIRAYKKKQYLSDSKPTDVPTEKTRSSF